MGNQRARHHKSTVICPMKDCNYHSRVMITIQNTGKPSKTSLSEMNSVFSKHCPKHGLILECIGSSKYAVDLMKEKLKEIKKNNRKKSKNKFGRVK